MSVKLLLRSEIHVEKEREAPNSAVNEKQETILSQVGHTDDSDTNNNQCLKGRVNTILIIRK